MIEVDRLLYKIDQRLNKLSTNRHQQIQLEDKILALNEAQIVLLKTKVDGITGKGFGLDSFKKRYIDTQLFAVDYTSLKLRNKRNKLNQWSADLSELNPDFMLYIDSYILANKGRCKNRILWVNRDLLKHGDLQFVLNNEHYKPSFEYQETCNSISSNEISIFTDGTFSPTTIHVMYLRYPKYIDKSGYTKFDGTASSDVNCELESYLEDELLDLTALHLGMNTENVSASQNSMLRANTNE